MPDDCIFCRIVAGSVPSDKLHEDAEVIAIRDISPRAPTHILVLPRAHIPSVTDLSRTDGPLLGAIFGTIADLADKEGIASRGYRVVANVGEWGGQSVDHLHFHLLGGRNMAWPPG
jgi:histidine triad (HIT) family protein